MALFGNAPYSGLLNSQQQSDALSQGLLGFGGKLMQAGGWSKMPTTLGQNLGAAMPSFMEGYNQSANTAIAADDKLAARNAAAVAAQNAAYAQKQKELIDKQAQDQRTRMMAVANVAYRDAVAKNDTQTADLILADPGAFMKSQLDMRVKAAEYGMKPQTTKQAMDLQTNKPVFATEAEIKANPSRYAPVPTGMKIVSDGQGGFTVSTGMAGSTDLTNGAVSKQQDAYMVASGGLALLNNAEAGWNPEYSTIATQTGMSITALAERLGAETDPARKEELSKYTSWARNVQDNLSTQLNQLSGAAVSPEEYKRISASLPTLNDSPTEFMAKLKGAKEKVILSMARAHAFANKGINAAAADGRIFDTTLDQMKARINARGAEYMSSVSKLMPNAKPEEIRARVNQKIRAEFGIPALGS